MNKTALLALILVLTSCGPQRSVGTVNGPGPDGGGLHTGPGGGTTGGNPTLLPVDPSGGDKSLSDVSLCFARGVATSDLNGVPYEHVEVLPFGLDLATGVMKLRVKVEGNYTTDQALQLDALTFTLSTGCSQSNNQSAAVTNAFGTFGTTELIQFKVTGVVRGTPETPNVADVKIDFSEALKRLKAVQPVASTSPVNGDPTTVDGNRPDQANDPSASTSNVSTSQQMIDAIQGSYPLID